MIKLLLDSVISLIFAGSVMAALNREDFGPKLEEIAERLHRVCTNRSEVAEETIAGVATGIFPEDIRIKKYMECLLLEAKVMDQNHVINYEPIEKYSPPQLKEKLLHRIQNCYDKTEGITPLYQRIYDLMKCVYEDDPENFIIF
ncbi:hypothetical protein JTB14_005723 [Gonioctena quinquepunctata]|nr:hypothetical protein JTB14_005723 [Gonioctena quinquepunctata]